MLRRFCFLGNPFLKCRFCSPKMGVLESLINWFLVIFQLRCRKISWWGWSNWFATRIHRFSARSTNIKNHCYPFLPCNTELSLLKFFIFWGSRLTILLDIHNMLAKGFRPTLIFYKNILDTFWEKIKNICKITFSPKVLKW